MYEVVVVLLYAIFIRSLLAGRPACINTRSVQESREFGAACNIDLSLSLCSCVPMYVTRLFAHAVVWLIKTCNILTVYCFLTYTTRISTFLPCSGESMTFIVSSQFRLSCFSKLDIKLQSVMFPGIMFFFGEAKML